MNRSSFLQNRALALLVLILALALVGILTPNSGFPPAARAATTNVAISNPGVMLIPLHLSGQYTTTTTAVARFAMPMPCDMIGVSAVPRSMGSTALAVDVKSGGTTILSSPMTMVAGTVTEGTISTAAVPDENVITVDINAPAGTSTMNDTTVLLTCVRK